MTSKLFCLYWGAKNKISEFIKKEKGGSEIIAMVLLIAIVLVLGGIFWDNIKIFFDGLWTSVTGKDPTGGITK